MAISYPLSEPFAGYIRTLRFKALSAVGLTRSPFTFEQQVYAWQGDLWMAEVELVVMERADAEACIAALLALNGREGTFTMGDPTGASPRGSWLQGSPSRCVNGAHAAGVKSIAVKNFVAGATWKAGDYLQFGTAAAPHLHKVVQDGVAGAGGTGTIEIWPRTREALADGDGFTVDNTVGLWRLDSNERGWSQDDPLNASLRFSCMEAL